MVWGRPVLEHQFDGNHAVASESATPWRLQLNVLAAYAYFYNPLNFARTLLRPKNSLALAGAHDQFIGMIGLAKTALHSTRWAYRMWRGPIERASKAPGPKMPLVDVSKPVEVKQVRRPRIAAALPNQVVPLRVGA